MCIFCGNPGLVHASGSYAYDLGTSGGTGQSGAAAAAIPANSEGEITFLSGVSSGATVAGTSFWTWNGNSPATYGTTSFDSKWGSSTIGTPGGNVTYWFDAASNWTATERTALASGLALWSAEANISFSLATSAGAANFTFR